MVGALEEANNVVEGVQDYSSGSSCLGLERRVGVGRDGASDGFCGILVCCSC